MIEGMGVILSLGTGAVYIYFIFWLMSLMLGSNEAANASLKEMNNAKDRMNQRIRQQQKADHDAQMKALRGENE
ncbi:hypothetical protein [Enterobacter hormaechei]|uniref:hypothetical protein n=1 Tax=Enterobacter hormaechei TaxID=158836 RepID=UPI0022367758|nr:hypothetical protein [Enterobacter hormaechei]MCW4831856.1 hypothetical protein [Enterobacter hormaechei subsp. xiangfangensis]